MKISQNFEVEELVDRETWNKYSALSMKFIDPKLVPILEKIRELCGNKPMNFNDWHRGGKLQYRGYRPASCTVGAPKSMHRQGKAQDFTVKGMSAEAVRNVIRKNSDLLFSMGLRRIEKSVSWVHIDLKETGLNTIYEFNP